VLRQSLFAICLLFAVRILPFPCYSLSAGRWRAKRDTRNLGKSQRQAPVQISNPTRRDIIRHGLAASALVLAPSRLFSAIEGLSESQARERPWLAAALKAERWLTAAAIHGTNGISWPADPQNPKSVSTDLYNGMAGVVLFYLELHNATKDESALKMARGGADFLVASLPDETGNAPMGLYTGIAGTAIVLSYAHSVTGDERYQKAIDRALLLLQRGARVNSSGVEWNDSTDIISGSAGIGLALISLSRQKTIDARQLAALTGDRLIERSQVVDDGRVWLISPQMPRNYPNFSHGTAGVSYFLTYLSGLTGSRGHLEAALAGERYLNSIATATPNGGRMIYHSMPGNDQLYYLSWCHGPAGTARLYRALSSVTRDPTWDVRVRQLALGIQHMKVPERSPGFWNNISQCCGNCGVSDFFLAMYRQSGDASHLTYAEDIGHDTLARATADGDGMKWIQAEHRVRPELLVAQTGLMQGAAGVGLAMLHLDGARAGRKRLVVLPDDPF
jgi:lantibiotic modifying enzyme